MKNGKIIGKYKSLAEAAEKTKIDPSSIGKNCRGTYKSAGGFIWKYDENEAENEVEHL